jgi:hypothetical protein
MSFYQSVWQRCEGCGLEHKNYYKHICTGSPKSTEIIKKKLFCMKHFIFHTLGSE